jgi:hypothetical protein
VAEATSRQSSARLHGDTALSQTPTVLVLDDSLRKGIPMLDVILLALGFGLFALAVAYAFACDRL